MHWCAYASPTHSLIQASKHNETAKQSLTTCWKAVGVTGKISKWQLERRATKLLSSFFLQHFTDIKA